MTLALDNFQTLKRQIEELLVRSTELRGRFKELRKQMEEKHGCPDLKAARKKLAKLEKEKNALYDKYVKVKKEFEDKWGEQLEQVEASREGVSVLPQRQSSHRRIIPAGD
jgi:predicted nuclease with TOPRIM domain